MWRRKKDLSEKINECDKKIIRDGYKGYSVTVCDGGVWKEDISDYYKSKGLDAKSLEGGNVEIKK
jgi:hypothetical protein